MALGYLFIFFIIMVMVSIIGISLLYLVKNKAIKNVIFYALAAWSMLIACLSATSLPSNYLFKQMVAWSFGIVSIIAIIMKYKNPEKNTIPHIMVTVSTLLGLYLLFFN